MVGLAFVSAGQAAVAEQPGDGSFDHPAVCAESFAGFDAFAGDPNHDAAVAYPPSQVGVVVGFVGVQLRRFAAAWATSRSDRGNGPDERFECVGVVGVRGRDGRRQR